jgi:hypothetical protein
MEYFKNNEETYIYPGQEPSVEWEKIMFERYDIMTKQLNEHSDKILLSISNNPTEKLLEFFESKKPISRSITGKDISTIISFLDKKSKTVTKSEMKDEYEDEDKINLEKAETIAEKLMPSLIINNIIPEKIDHLFVTFLKETDTVLMMSFFYLVVLTLERYKKKCNRTRLDFYIKVCHKHNRMKCAKILRIFYTLLDKETQINPITMPILLMGGDIGSLCE